MSAGTPPPGSDDKKPAAAKKAPVKRAATARKAPVKRAATARKATAAPAKKVVTVKKGAPAPAKKATAASTKKTAPAKKATTAPVKKAVTAKRVTAAPAVTATANPPDVLAPPADDAGGRHPRGRAGRAPRAVRPLSVLCGALLVAVLVVSLLNVRHGQKVDAGTEAEKVVADHVTRLISYSPSSVTSDLATEQKWLTGDFADEYKDLVTNTVAPSAVKAGVTVNATVVARGIEDEARDEVTVLLFVNLSTTKTGTTEAATQGSRVRVTAQKINGSWLISEMKPL